MSGLASGAESMTEHKAEGRLQHCFIRLLKAGLFIEGENFAGEANFLSALARKRSICAQSTVCSFCFFIWSYKRNTLIVPDVFQKRIFASKAGLEFRPGSL
jgi:hypothetical protein